MFAAIVAPIPASSMTRASTGTSRPCREAPSIADDAAAISPSPASGSSAAEAMACPWSRARV